MRYYYGWGIRGAEGIRAKSSLRKELSKRGGNFKLNQELIGDAE